MTNPTPLLINLNDVGVFNAKVPLSEVQDWLVDPGADLVDVNEAIDNAASWAADCGNAYVVIQIAAPSDGESLQSKSEG